MFYSPDSATTIIAIWSPLSLPITRDEEQQYLYVLRMSKNETFEIYEDVYVGEETNYTVTGLESATTYYFKVAAAINDSTLETGPFSQLSSSTTSGTSC